MSRGSTTILSFLVGTALAAPPTTWVAFDATYPEHFVDVRSIVRISKDVVRYWDGAGAFPNGDGPDGKFPQYSLSEINCRTHMMRSLRWDVALEAGRSSAGMKARADFQVHTAELQKGYPSAWESLEPAPHLYALLDFVCAKRAE